MFTRTYSALSVLFFVAVIAPAALSAFGAELAENRVAAIIDVSGSFKDKQAKAISSVAEMLEAMTDVKLKRWEPATDKILLISLDAMPEVVWSGNLQDLKKLDEKSWKSIFEKRTDYVKCTDVTKAFQLAVDELNKDAGPKTCKYMFVYSDLVHEPPTNTICNCAPIDKKTPVPSEIPWNELQQIRVAAFWVPGQQKYMWSKAIEEHGLTDSFSLYASESDSKEILPPPRPENRPTVQEATATREQTKSWLLLAGKALGIGVGGFLGIILLMFIGMGVVSRFRRPGRSQGRPNVGHQPRRLPMRSRPMQQRTTHDGGAVRRP